MQENQKYNGDKGYAGEKRIKTPKKKPKNKEMSPEIKEDNKQKSRERIFVEHLIRVVKIFRVASMSTKRPSSMSTKRPSLMSTKRPSLLILKIMSGA